MLRNMRVATSDSLQHFACSSVAHRSMLQSPPRCRQDGQNSQADLKRESQAKIKAALLDNERKHFSKGDDSFEGAPSLEPSCCRNAALAGSKLRLAVALTSAGWRHITTCTGRQCVGCVVQRRGTRTSSC